MENIVNFFIKFIFGGFIVLVCVHMCNNCDTRPVPEQRDMRTPAQKQAQQEIDHNRQVTDQARQIVQEAEQQRLFREEVKQEKKRLLDQQSRQNW